MASIESKHKGVDGADDGDHWGAVTHTDPLGCPCCAADVAVAPFVGWLRETREPDMYLLLLAQALSINALEQLGAQALDRAPWTRLDVTELMSRVRERCLPPPSAGEVRRVAAYLLRFLSQRGLLSRRDWKRLRTKVRHAQLRPLD